MGGDRPTVNIVPPPCRCSGRVGHSTPELAGGSKVRRNQLLYIGEIYYTRPRLLVSSGSSSTSAAESVRDFYELWIESRCPASLAGEGEEEEEEDALFQDESTVEKKKSDQGKVEIRKCCSRPCLSLSLRQAIDST